MNFTIRWKDCDRSPSVESHIEEKITTLDKFEFLDDKAKFEIVHYSKQQMFKTRINAGIRGGKTLHAEAEAKDIISSINQAFDKVVDQMRRVKTKLYNK